MDIQGAAVPCPREEPLFPSTKGTRARLTRGRKRGGRPLYKGRTPKRRKGRLEGHPHSVSDFSILNTKVSKFPFREFPKFLQFFSTYYKKQGLTIFFKLFSIIVFPNVQN
jgi:hypothetical protein